MTKETRAINLQLGADLVDDFLKVGQFNRIVNGQIHENKEILDFFGIYLNVSKLLFMFVSFVYHFGPSPRKVIN